MVTEEKYVSTGSGSPMAYGLLEDAYAEGKTISENIQLGIRALQVAIKRDCASGDGVNLVTITKDGVRQYTEDEVAAIVDEKNHQKKRKA